MKKREYRHGGSTFKCVVLLLKCIFASIGYGLLWLGLVFMHQDWWIASTVCGAVITFLSLVLFVINPLFNGRQR